MDGYFSTLLKADSEVKQRYRYETVKIMMELELLMTEDKDIRLEIPREDVNMLKKKLYGIMELV